MVRLPGSGEGRKRVLDLTTPFVGQRAATLSLDSADGIVFSAVVGIPGALIVAFGSATRHEGIAFAAIPFGIAFLYGVVYRFWMRHLYYLETSRAIGVKVSMFHPVPLQRDRYLRWCERRGGHSIDVSNSS